MSGAGLQVWDASGLLVLDTTSILASVLGTFTIGGDGTASGSFQDGRLGGNVQPFYLIQSIEVAGPAFLYRPSVTFSGTTVQWSFPSTPDGTLPTTTIIWGIY